MYRRRSALIVLCLANFLILLDSTIVNTAAPRMMTALGMSVDEALWVLNGYLLAFASLLIVSGRLGDLLGPRRVFVAGLALFSASSVLCGLSQSAGPLIAARVLQGVAAAALLPQALVLISAIFPPDRRGAAFGVFTAVAGIAAVSGPTLGGLVVTEVGWPAIFYLNLPIGLVALVLAPRFIPDLRPSRRSRLDPGVLLATAGLGGVVFSLIEGQRYGWVRVAVPVLAVSVLLLVWFLVRDRRQREPMLPPALFADRTFSLATAITVITAFALSGFLLVFVLQTQTLLGMSPFRSGLTALPWTLALSAVAPVAGRLTDRIGGRTLLVAGLAAQALGVLGVAFLTTRSASAGTFAAPLVLVGIGMGMSISPTTTEAMRRVAPVDAGAASGVLNTARQTGAALGAAAVGAVLQNRLLAALHRAAADRAGQLPAQVRRPFVAGVDEAAARGLRLGTGQTGVAVPHDVAPLVRAVFGDGFVAATRPTLGVVAAVLLVGCLLAAGLADIRHTARS